MPFHFIHAADIHLGHEQYNLPARADDFAKAWLAMVDFAVESGVDFVLVAGDLFHHARADAWTLKQAMHGLEVLRDARIPTLAVEGNHDAQHYYKNLSWMEFLCDHGLLVLLNMEGGSGGPKSMVPFDGERRRGSWIDVAGARVYGLKYYGAATGKIIDEIARDVTPGPEGYTIMMLHAGMAGQVPHMHGGLTPAQLEPLRPAVDYFALGHVHKRLIEAPVYNPGSLETNSFEEMDWDHGFFHVRVDLNGERRTVVTPVETPNLRRFRRISVAATGDETLAEFVALAEERISSAPSVAPGAVVELSLGGTAGFNRQDVPIETLKAAIELRLKPLVVRARNALAPPGLVSRATSERHSRADLERSVVEGLVYNNPDYRDGASGWTRLILDVKNMAVEGDLPANIVDRIRDTMQRIDEDAGSDEAPRGSAEVDALPLLDGAHVMASAGGVDVAEIDGDAARESAGVEKASTLLDGEQVSTAAVAPLRGAATPSEASSGLGQSDETPDGRPTPPRRTEFDAGAAAGEDW